MSCGNGSRSIKCRGSAAGAGRGTSMEISEVLLHSCGFGVFFLEHKKNLYKAS